MSKKRTSPESSNGEQTNEGSDLFQQDGNAKRAKLIPSSDTTLQDLPMELIECILVKAVAMEVKDTKLAKSVWKEKADSVINRLRTVCSQWSSILTTNFFRNELHRTLERTAQETIRLEILHQSPLPLHVYTMTTLKDEIFMFCRLQDGELTINVYDRNNLAQVKDVISLPEIVPESMAACSVSNCVYILYRRTFSFIKISRITKDAEHQFNIAPLISVMWTSMPMPTLSVAANGNIIFSRQQKDQEISIYNADGSLQHQMTIYRYSDIPRFTDIIPKSNGNLVLVSTNDQMQTTLTEIDMDVTIIRQYQPSHNLPMFMYSRAIHADIYGRLLLIDRYKEMELLDSEFNRLDFSGSHLHAKEFVYNSERNEIVAIVNDKDFPHGVLTIFRFTE